MSKKYKKENFVKLFPYKRKEVLSLSNDLKKYSWSISAFDMPEIWKKSQGEGIVIGLLDTGCQADHIELGNNILPGINILDPKKEPDDGQSHGTHLAGTICADNKNNVVGIAPKAKIRPIKVLDDNGNSNLDSVAKGIKWAIEQKVDIISMSLGCPKSSLAIHRELKKAYAKGILIFTAAGNAGKTKELFYPANYSEVISIGAIDKDFKRAKFSATGHELDFMCPGVEILSTVPPNWYAIMSGTSQAQPFACGVAALLLAYSRNTPNAKIKIQNNEDIKNVFKQYATPIIGEHANDRFWGGYGIIDPNFLKNF